MTHLSSQQTEAKKKKVFRETADFFREMIPEGKRGLYKKIAQREFGDLYEEQQDLKADLLGEIESAPQLNQKLARFKVVSFDLIRKVAIELIRAKP